MNELVNFKLVPNKKTYLQEIDFNVMEQVEYLPQASLNLHLMVGVTRIIMMSLLSMATIYQSKSTQFLEHSEKFQIHILIVIQLVVTVT